VGCGILKYFVVRGELSFALHEKKQQQFTIKQMNWRFSAAGTTSYA